MSGTKADGLIKLLEELGELQQVACKKLSLDKRAEETSYQLEEEIADVIAACKLVIGTYGLRNDVIEERISEKLRFYQSAQNK